MLPPWADFAGPGQHLCPKTGPTLSILDSSKFSKVFLVDFLKRPCILTDSSGGSKTDQNFNERGGMVIAGEINHDGAI